MMEKSEQTVWLIEVTIKKYRDGEISREECLERMNDFMMWHTFEQIEHKL